MVRSAHFDASPEVYPSSQLYQLGLDNRLAGGILHFGISAGDDYPRLPHEIYVRVGREVDPKKGVIAILLNGEIYSDYREGQVPNTIIINAPGWGICDQSPFEFAIIFGT